MSKSMTVYDFHTHTFLSDGQLSPIEVVRRALTKQYRAIGLTDHVGVGRLATLISEVNRDCTLAEAHWDIIAIPGVELTHIPVKGIAETAKQAKEMGARLVIVHGETITEPVEKGTNMAAVQCPYVDILAHPGLLTLEEAQLAATNGIFIELTARKGHSLTNGHIAKVARIAGAKLLVNSDAHDEQELLTSTLAYNVAKGSGLDECEIDEVLTANSCALLNRLRR